MTRMTGTLHEDVCELISLNSFSNEKCFRQKLQGKSNHAF